MVETEKRLPARFFETETGRVPVREWLLELRQVDRKVIGDDICAFRAHPPGDSDLIRPPVPI